MLFMLIEPSVAIGLIAWLLWDLVSFLGLSYLPLIKLIFSLIYPTGYPDLTQLNWTHYEISLLSISQWTGKLQVAITWKSSAASSSPSDCYWKCPTGYPWEHTCSSIFSPLETSRILSLNWSSNSSLCRSWDIYFSVMALLVLGMVTPSLEERLEWSTACEKSSNLGFNLYAWFLNLRTISAFYPPHYVSFKILWSNL